jgi:hypothetical protein
MDTRFWGPSGWKLLHLITMELHRNTSRSEQIFKWFQLLPYVLPCKYCRASLQDYYNKEPLTHTIMKSPDTFGHWLYNIHNRVNNKLRKQGLLSKPNPSWSSVETYYKTLHATLCTSPLIGWDFLSSIAYTTPSKHTKSVPLPGYSGSDMKMRNKFNMLTREERIEKLRAWWNLIPSILPCAKWRAAWKSSSPPLEEGRDAVADWLWDLEESVCLKLKCPTPHSSLPALKHEMSAFESSCSSSSGLKKSTCRTLRAARRRAVLTRRRKRIQQDGGAVVL